MGIIVMRIFYIHGYTVYPWGGWTYNRCAAMLKQKIAEIPPNQSDRDFTPLVINLSFGNQFTYLQTLPHGHLTNNGPSPPKLRPYTHLLDLASWTSILTVLIPFVGIETDLAWRWRRHKPSSGPQQKRSHRKVFRPWYALFRNGVCDDYLISILPFIRLSTRECDACLRTILDSRGSTTPALPSMPTRSTSRGET